MVADPKRMELEKALNMARTFGFEVQSSSVDGDLITLRCEKQVSGMSGDQRRFEVDRLTNVLKALGWEKTGDAVEGDKVSFSIRKTVKAEV